MKKPAIMADQTVKDQVQKDQSPDSVVDKKAEHDEDVGNINYPPPWKYEKFFIGGYSHGRMFNFKSPKTMYKTINLFAGLAIMFYGYDQGVMALVNQNEDYWTYSRSQHFPMGNSRVLTRVCKWASTLPRTVHATLLPKGG